MYRYIAIPLKKYWQFKINLFVNEEVIVYEFYVYTKTNL